MIGPFSAFVVFAMVWAMVFLIGLQIGQDTQGDRGERVPGTHLSSPVRFDLWRRVAWATVIAVAVTALLVWLIVSGLITIDGIRWLTGRPTIG